MRYSNNISTSIEQEERARLEEETRQWRAKCSSISTGLLCTLFTLYLLSSMFHYTTTGYLRAEPAITYPDNRVSPTSSALPTQGATETKSTQAVEVPATTSSTRTSALTTTTTTETSTAEAATTTTAATETAETITAATTEATGTVTSSSTAPSEGSFVAKTNPETGFPLVTSEDDWKSIQTACSTEHAGCAVYVMENSGMGSALFGVFKQKIFQRVTGRPYFILDESRYPYYRSADGSTGVLTTFFTPNFPIMDDSHPFHYIDEILPEGQSMTGMIVKKPKKSAYANTYTEASPIVTLRRPDNRRYIDPYFVGGNFTEEDLWRMMGKEMCPNLKYNEVTRQKVKAVKAERGFPNFDEPDTRSVTFHVRRTDKVDQSESIAFSGESYVSKLLEAHPGANPDHCYVATDDATAVAEVKQALRDAQLMCQVWNLPDDKKAGGREGKFIRSTYDESIIFLTELSIMVEATYFVGTWDSNVGVMATVLRGCPEYGRQEIAMGNSFHVDENEFMHSRHAGRR